MSRRMSLSHRARSAAHRSAAGALALTLALGLSACGGDDEGATTTAAQNDTGAAASAGDAAPHDETNSDGHHPPGSPEAEAAAPAAEDHDAGAGATAADHEHTPGMDMSGQGAGQHKKFDELEKEAAIPASKPFNYQDVSFSQHMIDHHGQAVEMAEMLLAKTKNPEMKKLANAIHGAQAPEIAMMTKWLKSWGQSTENAAHGHDPAAPSAGMMTDEDMAKLNTKKGKAFDKLFLEQMIFHHQGAVNQSNKQIKNGKYPPAIKLAKAIIKAQTKEIALMKQVLKKV
jgi:uncharacterized protein (DUF305 family)